MTTKMKRYLIILYTMLSFSAYAHAQDTVSVNVSDLEKALRENKRLQASIEADSLTMLDAEKQRKALEKGLIGKEKELQKLVEKNEKLKKEVEEKVKPLKDSLEKVTTELQAWQLKNENIKRELGNLAQTATVLEEQKKDLEAVQQKVEEALTSEGHIYLKQAFSTMSNEKLQEMMTECDKYKIDDNIQQLKKEVEQTLANKKCYETALATLHSKYNAASIANAKHQLAQLTALSDAQSVECRQVVDLMNEYEGCQQEFEAFVRSFNKKRAGFDKTDKDACQRSMENHKNRNEAMVSHLKSIPYLKLAYEQYVKEATDNPAMIPDIEKEAIGK